MCQGTVEGLHQIWAVAAEQFGVVLLHTCPGIKGSFESPLLQLSGLVDEGMLLWSLRTKSRSSHSMWIFPLLLSQRLSGTQVWEAGEMILLRKIVNLQRGAVASCPRGKSPSGSSYSGCPHRAVSSHYYCCVIHVLNHVSLHILSLLCSGTVCPGLVFPDEAMLCAVLPCGHSHVFLLIMHTLALSEPI